MKNEMYKHAFNNQNVLYSSGGFVTLVILLLLTYGMNMVVKDPSEDIIFLYSNIGNMVSFIAIGCIVIAGLNSLQYGIVDLGDNDFTPIIKFLDVMKGCILLTIITIPILLCFGILMNPIVPDLIKGLIAIPLVIYTMYSIGNQSMYGSIYDLGLKTSVVGG